MFVALDGLLILVTTIILLVGLGKRLSRSAIPSEPTEHRDWFGLVLYLLSHQRIFRKPWTGLAHLILVWGTVLFMGVVLLDQMDAILPANQPLVFSFLLDLTGVLMLASTLFFLIKGWVQPGIEFGIREARKRLIPLVLLMLILISGFFAEGFRLSIQSSGSIFNPSAPVGSLFAFFVIDSPLLMQVMIRFHIYLVLALIASLPYTFMRHAVTSAVSVLVKVPVSRVIPAAFIPEEDLIISKPVEQIDWRCLSALEGCLACGRCTENCPAFSAGKPLQPGSLMQETNEQFNRNLEVPSATQLETLISPEAIWNCTNCLACATQCPVHVRPVDLLSLMRRHQVMALGALPDEARVMMRALDLYGDPMGKGPALRNNQAGSLLSLPAQGKLKKSQSLLWIGCSGAFHPQAQESTNALLKILEAGKVDIATLGSGELCCGEPAKSLGDEDLFKSLAIRNIKALDQAGVKEVITHCPHCYHMLKNAYPEFGGVYQVRHSSEVIADLIRDQRINLKYPINSNLITIHDPCYLGRSKECYQPLRDICTALFDSQLRELPRSGENTFCCGGGGGNMWLHETSKTPINQIRAQEIDESSAGIVATACPFCLTMMTDGLGSLEKDETPQAVDFAKLVADSLGL